MSWGDLDIIRRFLDEQLKEYIARVGENGTKDEPKVGFSEDMKLRAGMIVIDCKDDSSVAWLAVTIDDLCTNHADIIPDEDQRGDSNDLVCCGIRKRHHQPVHTSSPTTTPTRRSRRSAPAYARTTTWRQVTGL